MEDWIELSEVNAICLSTKYPNITVTLYALAVGEHIMYKVKYNDVHYLILRGDSSSNEEYSNFGKFHIRDEDKGMIKTYFIDVPYWK